jgi:hypothetical protein
LRINSPRSRHDRLRRHADDARATIYRLWKPTLRAWFAEGEDDPRINLLRVDPMGGEYWNNRHGAAVAGIKMLFAPQRTRASDLVGRRAPGAEMRSGAAIKQPVWPFKCMAAVSARSGAPAYACCVATFLTKCARPRGVNEAFLWLFIRGTPASMGWCENPHLPRPRVNNLLGNDT